MLKAIPAAVDTLSPPGLCISASDPAASRPRGCCSLLQQDAAELVGIRETPPHFAPQPLYPHCNAAITYCWAPRSVRQLRALRPEILTGEPQRTIVSVLCGQVSWSFMGIYPPIEAGTLGMWDTMIVMILALVVFGPRRLPKIGRQIGKLMYEFRKASNDFRYQMEEELRNAEEADRRQREEAERQRALAAAPPPQIEASNAAPAAESADTDREEHAESSHGGPEEPDSYDAAILAQHQAEIEPEQEQLRVQPPATGAPVPAESPTSRATAPPAEQAEEPADLPEAPSGDEAAASKRAAPGVDSPVPENHPAGRARAETEPATHHG